MNEMSVMMLSNSYSNQVTRQLFIGHPLSAAERGASGTDLGKMQSLSSRSQEVVFHDTRIEKKLKLNQLSRHLTYLASVMSFLPKL